MDLMPILSTLKRHKIAAGLIVLQIALTCAIVSNALFLISQRVSSINAPTGLAEQELLVLQVSSLVRVENPEVQTRVDMQALRGLAGVKSAALVNQIPFGDNTITSGLRLTPQNTGRAVGVATYNSGDGWLQTLGLRLAEGRDFEPGEYAEAATVFKDDQEPKVPAVIISKLLAEHLFPGRSAVGQEVYIYGAQPQRVVGVLERLPAIRPTGVGAAPIYTMMLPIQSSYRGGSYVLRVAPEQRDAVLKAAVAALEQASGGVKRIVRDQRRFEDMRSKYYRQDFAMLWLLGGVCLALLVVTAFGIVGLASFWVQQRTRMIGTRRALGATRGQILRYFQAENFLLSSLGIALGMLGAYGLSLALMQHYELPRLPWVYLPIGALVLWALGQLAVWAPARRAAALPPVVALRGA